MTLNNLRRRVAALEQAAPRNVPSVLCLRDEPHDAITVGDECFTRSGDETDDAFRARVTRAAAAMGCALVFLSGADEGL